MEFDRAGRRIRAVARCPECAGEVPFVDLLGHLVDCLGIEPGSRLLVGPLIVNVQADAWKGGDRPVLLEGVEFDRDRFLLRVLGYDYWLTKLEGLLLDYFITHPNILLGRQRILDAVWGQDVAANDREVDAYVRRLRRLLRQHPQGESLISTVRGVGYRLNAQQ